MYNKGQNISLDNHLLNPGPLNNKEQNMFLDNDVLNPIQLNNKPNPLVKTLKAIGKFFYDCLMFVPNLVLKFFKWIGEKLGKKQQESQRDNSNTFHQNNNSSNNGSIVLNNEQNVQNQDHQNFIRSQQNKQYMDKKLWY